MFSLFKKSAPVFCDAALEDLSRMLTQEDERPTYRRELLQAERLDFTLESLKHIDEYLEIVRQDEIPNEHMTPLVLRVGAYAGEVIRRNTTDIEFHWLDYKQGARRSSMVRSNGMCLELAAMLWSSDKDMCFPLAKVCKFIENGPEDSLYFLATVLTTKREIVAKQIEIKISGT